MLHVLTPYIYIMRKQQLLFFSFEKSLVVRGYGNIMLTLIIIIKSIVMRRYRIKHVWRIAQGGSNFESIAAPSLSRSLGGGGGGGARLNQPERENIYMYYYSSMNRKLHTNIAVGVEKKIKKNYFEK